MSTTIAPSPASAETAAPAKGGKGKKILIAVVVLALAAGAAWFLVLKPKGDTAPKPGDVLTLEAIQVNLAGGHYLRLGMALQAGRGRHGDRREPGAGRSDRCVQRPAGGSGDRPRDPREVCARSLQKEPRPPLPR
ncbi:hypothetical protein G5V59_12655 [Nocardioides sp. W3-2-3]|uniref:hypothetical protein n=1 Tax=Nocardioides convexus TaxID=2712224 RepID=UPI0024186390|nr:hypothetical protein [Nocardioides convexus]NHA00583.1 hypothetical protein [Nocardioides convexus]